jgi:hypothetical protein
MSSGPTEIQSERDDKGRFLNGIKGGPGRPKGSRSKLATEFIAALSADFDEHGAETIIKVRQRSPEIYLKIIGAIIPAKLETSLQITNIFAELNLRDPAEYKAAYQIAKQVMYGEPATIDVEAEHAWKADGED